MDSLLHLMKRNRGNRSFSERDVSKSIITKILEAGDAAPSGVIDGVHIYIVEQQGKRSDIHRLCVETEHAWLAGQPASVQERITGVPDYDPDLTFLLNAPLLLVVSTRPYDPEFPYAVESAFIAIGYMLVMANGMGLIAAPFAPSILHQTDENRLGNILKLPAGERIQALLPIGYPEKTANHEAKPACRNVFLNEFGNNYFAFRR